VCSDSDSGISNDTLTFLKLFPLAVLIRFPNVREKEKKLKPSFHYIRAVSISTSSDIIFQISTVKICGNELQTWCPNSTMTQWLMSSGS